MSQAVQPPAIPTEIPVPEPTALAPEQSMRAGVLAQHPERAGLAEVVAAINRWHLQAVRLRELGADAQEADRVIGTMFEAQMHQALRDYGDARVIAETAGAVPLAWVSPAMLGATQGYLRRCQSGGMRAKDARLVEDHVSAMLELNYLNLTIAQRVVDAKNQAGGDSREQR